ncbi:Uncharacterized protein, contains HEPN domain, UPF0332 family [Halomicrobium zhouii]|uniref:Uncharacterized protein, contains HEPN domain, UPF0332 family n=1 Tax=Halomicrobium zhouii TaxID=767519 RepID=A0A1I6KQ64_9EURY|nr:HEPN domain-containing protein [Halomicrobium zhouii]SFR93389.1 Uncharacterized protein, contains HEPN domain, UPF0332 family [Halomicrobium zhouii]
MSDDDVAREDVDREFEQAVQMLDDARKAHEVGISKSTVVNRLYYCCFHAAQAALYARGFDPQSHGAVQTLLGRELIKPGVVEREHGRFLNDVETYRRRADYGSGTVDRDADELVRRTSAFLDAMRSVAGDASE